MNNPNGVPSPDLEGEAGNMTEAELAAALGEELPEQPEPEPEAAPEPEPAAEAPVWKHEPSGKEFESELDMLRYESGWKDNKYGNELKEVKAKIEAYEKLMESAGEGPPKQIDPEAQEKALLKHALQGTGVDIDEVDAGAYKTILKMIENTLGLYDSTRVETRFKELQGTVEQITTRAQEAQALNQYGITADQVKDVLEKHPQLKALDRADRVAVIADLMKAGEAKKAAPETANPLRQALKPDASSHVEGSAGTAAIESGEASEYAEMAAKLDGNDRDLLRALGAATAAAGPEPWDIGG